MKEFRILMGGFGGQGVLVAGKLLAEACVEKGYYVSWMPSYGPEMRGGTCNCRIVISDEAVINPIFSSPNAALFLNDDSAVKYEAAVKDGGIILSNKSLVHEDSIRNKKCRVEEIDATEIAKEVGNVAMANIVMLGKLIREVDFLTIEDLNVSMAKKFKGAIGELNQKALRRGFGEERTEGEESR
jgi:2-oxoglutarate ferredoxin oxidoreductase subunit gamma